MKMAFGFQESDIVSVEMCFKLEAPGIGILRFWGGTHQTALGHYVEQDSNKRN